MPACYGSGCNAGTRSDALAWAAAGAGLWLVSAIVAPFEVRGWNRERGVTAMAAPTPRGAAVAIALRF